MDFLFLDFPLHKYGLAALVNGNRVFATSNGTKKLSEPLLSRFRVMYLNEYEFSQFYEISVKKLLAEGKIAVITGGNRGSYKKVPMFLSPVAAKMSSIKQSSRLAEMSWVFRVTSQI